MSSRVCLLMVAFFALGGCGPRLPAGPPPPPPAPAVTFTDVTAAAGIHFPHYNGAKGKKWLPETMGSGCAFLDYDNDGWQDILLVNGNDSLAKLGNRQSAIGNRTDRSDRSDRSGG